MRYSPNLLRKSAKKGGDSALFSSKNDDLHPNKRCESWVSGALFKLHFTVRVGQF